MPTTLTQPAIAETPRKRWTRTEYENLSAAALTEERLELVEGDLISKMGKKRPYVIGMNRMLEWLVQTFGYAFVNAAAPIDVAPEDNPSSEPEPDLIVLTREQSEFRANPQPGDLRLVVEIAEATLAFDLSTKARLYARAGIIEYWVVDLKGRRLIVHRDPRNGRYLSVAAYSENESVSPLAAPGSSLAVASVATV